MQLRKNIKQKKSPLQKVEEAYNAGVDSGEGIINFHHNRDGSGEITIAVYKGVDNKEITKEFEKLMSSFKRFYNVKLTEESDKSPKTYFEEVGDIPPEGIKGTKGLVGDSPTKEDENLRKEIDPSFFSPDEDKKEEKKED